MEVKNKEYEMIRERLRLELEKTVNCLLENYSNKSNFEYDIILYIAETKLHEVQVDAEQLGFVDFYKKHLNGTMFFDCDDFTKSEKLTIINESPLSDRDKNLAIAYWIDIKSEDTISNELFIDRKTVHNNIPKISNVLKRTAMIMYKK